MEVEAVGSPGYPPATQWVGKNIDAQRLKNGRHILYRDATSQGMSGSPLYYIDEKENKAIVVGVHVGGNRIIGNCAVPICYHMDTARKWITQPSSAGSIEFLFTFSHHLLKLISVIIFYHYRS